MVVAQKWAAQHCYSMRIAKTEFCYIKKHPPQWTQLPSGMFLSHNDEVIPHAPDDAALPDPLFILTVEIEERIDQWNKIATLNRYIITDGKEYWRLAVWCTNSYLTVDVLFDPNEYDLKMFRGAIQEFITSLSD